MVYIFKVAQIYSLTAIFINGNNNNLKQDFF